MVTNITERKQAEEESGKHREHLEELVEQRTAEPKKINEELRRDITARKRAEEALRESEERYHGLFNGVPVGLCRTTPEGEILDANPALVQMLGYPNRESLVAVNVADTFVNPQVRTQWQSLIEREGFVRDFEMQVRRRDGTVIWVRDSTRAVCDASGGVLYYEASLADMTERKRVEEAVRESEERFRQIVQQMPYPVEVHTPDGTATMVNRAFLDMFKVPSADLVVGKYNVFNDPLVMEELALRDDIKRVYGGETVFVPEIVVPLEHIDDQYSVKETGVVVQEVTMFPVLRQSGEIWRVVANWKDITEPKRAEEELRQSYVKLQRTLEGAVNALTSTIEMRDSYTAGHQRRVTQLACAIAKEMGLPEEQIEGIRMAGLIHDLGKINVPAEILSRPGPLTELEYGLIKMHPQVGHDVLKTIEFLWPVAQMVLQHHERKDGSGYPAGLSGEEIILEARILGVADVVEAMSSHRPYRGPRGLDKALEEISQNRGVLYDPEVVDTCLKLFTEKGFVFE